jgi:branched-subunit amino acid aminotransferase/4-amino-4-deoxychorismate lyase
LLAKNYLEHSALNPKTIKFVLHLQEINSSGLTTKVLLNGALIEHDVESLLSNRAMLYGDGFFETMYFSGKGIYLWVYHWRRIMKSAEILGLNIPDEQTIWSQIQSIQPSKGSRIKLIIYRKSSGTYFPDQITNSECIIFCTEQHITSNVPLSIGISNSVVLPIGNNLSGIKSLSSIYYVMAAIESSKSSFDDLILMNSSNEISECISSNIFVIRGDKIFTPPLSSGCVEGVCRSYILEGDILTGFEVIQKPLFLHDLANCDGMFISNAVYGIRIVGKYMEKEIDQKKSIYIQELINKSLFQ